MLQHQVFQGVQVARDMAGDPLMQLPLEHVEPLQQVGGLLREDARGILGFLC